MYSNLDRAFPFSNKYVSYYFLEEFSGNSVQSDLFLTCCREIVLHDYSDIIIAIILCFTKNSVDMGIPRTRFLI